LKILVIEDNPDIKEILDYILNDEGHEVVECNDGSSIEVLERLRPNLILMDEMLTGVRGSELIKKMKADEAKRRTPVILISAMPNLNEIAAQCGADAFIEKPFNLETLTDLIKNFT
jgi:two-component system, OmpR family, phosphate regulon response regulator PhoB